jgi:hypothetical protein
LAVIKQAVKLMLPAPVLNRLLHIKSQLQLQKVPAKDLDARNLRSRASLELSRIFSDPAITASWEQDHAPSLVYSAGGIIPRALILVIAALYTS